MAIVGRANHMLKIKGTVVYPQQIEEILLQEPGIDNFVLEAYRDDNECDAIKIMVGLQEQSNAVVEKIAMNLKARIRITPEIQILPSQEISKLKYRHGSRKPHIFTDLRPDAVIYK